MNVEGKHDPDTSVCFLVCFLVSFLVSFLVCFLVWNPCLACDSQETSYHWLPLVIVCIKAIIGLSMETSRNGHSPFQRTCYGRWMVHFSVVAKKVQD